jgi:hypothetical protein
MRSIFGFHVTFAVDAIADMSGDAHENGLRRIFPTPGGAGATAEIIAPASPNPVHRPVRRLRSSGDSARRAT